MAGIKQYLDNILNSVFGKDVRQSIHDAIEQTYEDAAKNGNANMEVSEARGNFETLKKRLDNSDNEKANKTQTDNLQSQINGLASGSPLVASSVEEMTDTTRVYVNTTDGHWYYHTGSTWSDGGIYQATEIADESVTKQKLSNIILKNDFFNSWKGCSIDQFLTTEQLLKFYEVTKTGIKSIKTSNVPYIMFVSKEKIKKNKFPNLKFSTNVDTAKMSGFLCGFNKSNDTLENINIYTNRFLFGYEPVYGFTVYYNNNFITLENKINIANGTYNFELIKTINNKVTIKIIGENYNKEFTVPEIQNIDFSEYKYVYIQNKNNDLNMILDNFILIDNEYIDSEKIVDNSIGIEKLDSSIKLISYSEYGKMPGRNVHIYKFGGKGNDWCFVRTPSNYDPTRKKTYPFVICNHGNGWVMDGTPQKANWTKRTMYLQANDADYIANPQQYNLVPENHPDFLYSNPTIEKLLENGYIVCGCENFGDNLFGNNNCRNACVDFFYHMIENYNVENRCYMIGASNGAMTSLNALYLLGDKIKAMILQYPLTCLLNQYANYDNHKSSIRNAYNITNENITNDEFKKITKTHDPLYVNTINNIKLGYVPPIKIYYSNTDTVTVASYNALEFANMLENSNLVYEKIQVDSDNVQREHGDYAHFNPEEYLEFFEKYS